MSLSVLLATWRGFGVGIGVRGSSEWENITKRFAGLHGFVKSARNFRILGDALHGEHSLESNNKILLGQPDMM